MTRAFGCSLTTITILCLAAASAEANTYTFQTIDNPGDPNFNQLLGINNEGTIAGYFGDGMGMVPNNGYTWTKTGGFVAENFNPSAQTQVVAINNTLANGSYNTAGFYVDAAGANHGFTQIGGVQNTVDNPLTQSTPNFNQLLGLNDHNVAVGVYADSANNMHGYEIDLAAKTIVGITLPSSFNATSFMAAGINNSGWIAGNYTAAGVTHGFIDENGISKSFDDPNGNGTNTSFFGLNNNGQAVGSFVDANGTNGLVYNLATNTWQTVDDPNQSFTSAFTFNGTTLNGINDLGQVVGFYSDGTHVNGVLATATPEPAPIDFMLLGGVLILGARLKRKRSV
ncbi:MAG: hypothetical protein ABI165_19695 [Bryobacteraceae bacterium]